MNTVSPKLRAKWFARVRAAHQKETFEDYLELIADLIEIYQEARLSNLAEHLGVSNATANKVITRLIEEKYVEKRPYRSIFLTQKGKKVAERCKQRHRTIFQFLINLGVSPETANYDAEGIEHHVSNETLAIFSQYQKP